MAIKTFFPIRIIIDPYQSRKKSFFPSLLSFSFDFPSILLCEVMSNEVKVTPLFGADPEAPVASLMEMSGLRILLDCGWTEDFDTSMWDPFKEILETVNILLLSHGDLEHAGALPLLKGRWGLKMRVLATFPVQRMIQMVLYDTYYNMVERQEFDVFDMEDVDEAVDKVETLRYTEERRITTEEGEGLSLYPFPAGRTLGGCGWKIVQESQEIAYVVDYYHRNERLLSGLMFQALQRPSLLITDGMVGLPSLQRDQKEKLMLGIPRTYSSFIH
jgi:cleavage and polyadenylation specificity factor subunit 2